MAEFEDKDLGWLEKLNAPKASQIIFIRHGESKYKEVGRDLTDLGVLQIENTAIALKDYLDKFDCLLVVCSPAARAKASEEIFMDTYGRSDEVTKTSNRIRPLDMKNLDMFLKYDKEHATSIYGEMWLTDSTLGEENQMTESRKSVSHRASRFLYHFGRAIDRVARQEDLKIGVLVFTHMEIGVNYLQGIFPESGSFPVASQPVLKNGEPVIVELNDPQNDLYTVHARGVSSEVFYDNEAQTFTKRRGN